MGKPKYTRQVLKMPSHHGWRAKPGYKIFVANRGDVRFDIPQKWIVKAPGEQCDVEFRDRKPPKDDCIIQLSVWSHSPGFGADTPLVDFYEQVEAHDDPDTLWRGELHYEKRLGAELVWREHHYLDKAERREARSRQVFARCPTAHAVITMSYWPEDEGRFLPVWDELVRSLTLGVYIRNPLLGE